MAEDEGSLSLNLLLDAFVTVASEHNTEAILGQAVDLARLTTTARYGAAVALTNGAITSFVHQGLTQAELEALPHPPYGMGMLGAVLADRAAIRLDRLQDDPRSVGFPLHHVPMSAYLGVPVIADGELLGALYLAKPPGQGGFSDQNEFFMLALARQTALALKVTQLLASKEEQLAEREGAEKIVRLHQVVAGAANLASTVEDALQAALDAVCDLTHWDVGHAFLRDEDGELRSTGIWRMADPARFASFRAASESGQFRPGIGLPGRVLAERRALLITDMPEAGLPRSGEARAAGITSALAVPVMVRSEVVGVLEFFSSEARADNNEFSKVLGHLGTELGRVVERARADAKFQRYASDLEAANHQLRALDQVKTDFVSMASHELRTPLTSILGFASTMLSFWDTTPNDELRSYVEIIDRQAQRLARLVNALLATSRIESGTLATSVEPTDVGPTIALALSELGDRAAEVVVSCPDGIRVLADPDHLQQILLNYLGNALRYGDPPFMVTVADNGLWIELRVVDGGEGVSEDFRPRLFEKFSQADTGSTRRTGGTGLGLSIVKGLAEAMDGQVWFEPNAPRGACFVLRLRRWET